MVLTGQLKKKTSFMITKGIFRRSKIGVSVQMNLGRLRDRPITLSMLVKTVSETSNVVRITH
jgi:hypothetical protein